MKKIKIGIIGIGMVGGQLLRWFLKKGWKQGKNLFCYDIDAVKGFSDDVAKGDIVFICVPTPSNPDGSCNISIVEKTIEQFRDTDKIIVIKSTVEPETTAKLAKKYNCRIFFNPEFLTEKNAWKDFIKPDRQIVAPAETDEKSFEDAYLILKLLPVAPFMSPSDDCKMCSTETELVKYGANLFGSTKVSFFNMLYDRCKILGADFEKVRRGITSDKRIGPSWSITPFDGYRGYAGFCFTKDTNATIAHDEKLLQRLDQNDVMRDFFPMAIQFFRFMRFYNEALLKSQGYAVEEVSRHDEEVKKIFKKKEEKDV